MGLQSLAPHTYAIPPIPERLRLAAWNILLDSRADDVRYRSHSGRLSKEQVTVDQQLLDVSPAHGNQM